MIKTATVKCNWTGILSVIFAFIILPAVANAADDPSTASNRVITADLKNIKGPRSMVWQDCVGAGRAAEGLRAGWRQQLEECHRELGFKYLRMHGLLQDEMGVYSEDSNGNPRYNFQYIDDVYDFLLSIGMKPFVEFSFMPGALASGDGRIFWWQANVTPPRDYRKWDDLITALVKHWTERYGEAEVASWRFEVWNEPNLRLFWQPPAGTSAQDAYFELYQHTARDVTKVNPDYVVGGPAGAGPIWTRELIDFCGQEKVPIDFISFHSYGLGGGPSGLDQYGYRKLYLSPNLHDVIDTVNSQIPVVQQSSMPRLPIYITEWSASYSSRDPIHDTYFMAPFILEQLRHTESLNSMSFWTFTDIFEENGPAPRPFYGGFGLINYEDIRKPAFWAFKFLSMLGPTELENTDPSSYVCADNHGGVQVLLWNLTAPTEGGKISDQDYFFRSHPTTLKQHATIRLSHLIPGKYRLTIYRIGYHFNDPYSRYLEMGSPSDLSPGAVTKLKKLSDGEAVSQTTATVNADGQFETSVPVREDDVYFLSIAPN